MFEYHLYRKPALGTRLIRGHPLTQGLVFCAPLNEGAGAPIDLISGKQSTLSGAVGWQRGGFYSSAVSGIYADFGTLPLIPDGGAITIAVGAIVDNSTSAIGPFVSGGQLFSTASSSRFAFNLDYDTTDLASRVTAFDLGLPVHFAFTHDGSKTLGGVLRYRDAIAKTALTEQTPSGSYLPGGYTTRLGQFIGVLHYCYVYNRVLSATEIAQLHTNPYAIFQRSRRRLFVSGATIHAQELTASLSLSATLNKSVGKIVTASALTLSGSLTRSVGKTVSCTSKVVDNETMTRSVGKNLTAESKAVDGATMQRGVAKTVTASVTLTAGVVKQIAKTLTATALSLTASLVATFQEASAYVLTRVTRSGRKDSVRRSGRGDGIDRGGGSG